MRSSSRLLLAVLLLLASCVQHEQHRASESTKASEPTTACEAAPAWEADVEGLAETYAKVHRVSYPTSEFMVVLFAEKRDVIIDGAETGYETGELIQVEGGEHIVKLAGPSNYTPAMHVVTIRGTNVAAPEEVTFTRVADGLED